MEKNGLPEKRFPGIAKITYAEFSYLVKADLFRYGFGKGFTAFWKAYFKPGFRYTYFMRLTRFLYRKPHFLPLFWVSRFHLRHYSFLFGISIDFRTEIGPGLYIGQFSGIIVNPHTCIGKNCNS